MTKDSCKMMDPRVRRTRQLLHDALERLLETRDFAGISIQDITDAATLNRATFYDHYPDKAALLKCVVAMRFLALLEARGVRFDGKCGSALPAIALGVCDYLASLSKAADGHIRALDPHLESAVINVVKGMVLDGLRRHAADDQAGALGMAAAALSWAIYGGAKEWLEASPRLASERAAATITALVQPILASLANGEAERAVTEDSAATVSQTEGG